MCTIKIRDSREDITTQLYNINKSYKHHNKDLPIKDEIIDPLEQYALDHENDLHMHESNEIDKKNL